MNTITIGVDLAKSEFSVCEVDGSGRVLRRLALKRDAFAVWLSRVPTQHSSGGHARLGEISRRGDAYLRTF